MSQRRLVSLVLSHSVRQSNVPSRMEWNESVHFLLASTLFPLLQKQDADAFYTVELENLPPDTTMQEVESQVVIDIFVM